MKLTLFNSKLSRIFFLSLLLFTPLAPANNPSIENQITHYLNYKQQEQLALLEKLVNINSGTTNLAGVHHVGELLRPHFEKLGFKVHWVEPPPSLQRAGTLIAEHPGSKGKRLLLIGHLDTVFPLVSSFQHFKQKGNFATGPGVIDDKGGDLVILYALKALDAANALTDAQITVVLTGDEEDSGKPTSISRKPLIEAAKNSDIALDFEWATTIDKATIARRGIANWMIITEGNEAHSSAIFQKKAGFGAIYELARILDSIRIEISRQQYLSFNPALVLGGTTLNYDKNNSQGTARGKGNVIAKSTIAKGDFRFLSSEQKINAEKEISTIVGSHLPGTTASISFEDGIPAMPPTAANAELLEKYSQASYKLGYGNISALDPGSRGAGDISYIAALVSASLAGLGPVGSGAHSEEETLDLQSLTPQTQRAALLIYWLTHGD
ncbi:carboxypeptidase G2 [Legionella nautarum]|uniref:Carboxypeptidase G2 n=1 Tax=Legionella nautarum TaxID=45070 RepID=A0A0W0WMF8_9GAMM|nr:M20 family metallopeptidase [Legionella nautarum]KTD33524.1 carboxypeptidase G2 [Legionella nautarum]